MALRLWTDAQASRQSPGTVYWSSSV